jgi:hypothetical protein
MSALKSASFCFALLFMAGEIAIAANPQAGNTTAASRFFGRGRTIMPHLPARRPAPEPMDVSVGGKPFQNIYREPTLSPYLALDLLNDDGSGVPNFYAFYQPQRQQQQANEAQEARIRRLQQQLRTATAKGAVTRNLSGGMPTTGSSSQFMNLGGYYPDLR